VQVVSSFFFWVSGALVAIVYYFIEQHRPYLLYGRGITVLPAARSIVEALSAKAVTDLSVLPFLWQVMVMVWLLTTVVAIIVHWSGRPGMVHYLFAISLLLLLLLTKVIVSPILILGG